MSPTDRPTAPPAGRSLRVLRALTLVALLPAIALPLLVGLYDRQDPELWGFPFFFWSQLALIPMAAGLTVLAYYLAKAAERRRRAAAEHRAAGRRPEGR